MAADKFFKFEEVMENVENVPEKFKGLYSEVTEEEGDNYGKFVLDKRVKPLVDDYTDVNNSLQQSKTDNRRSSDESVKYRHKLLEYESLITDCGIDFDIDDDPVVALKVHIDSLMEKNKKGEQAQINLDKMKADFQKKFDTMEHEHNQKFEKFKEKVAKDKITSEAARAITEHKGEPKLLTSIIEAQCKVIPDEHTGNLVCRVVDADGAIKTSLDGGFLTVNDLVIEMKNDPDYMDAFESKDTPGGGGRNLSSNNNPRSGGGESKTPIDKIKNNIESLVGGE